MKKFLMVKTECLENILKCFADQEEFVTFSQQLSSAVDEITFASQVANRAIDNENLYTIMSLKQLFIIALLFKNNIELIHQMIRVVDYLEITEEDKINDIQGHLNQENIPEY